MNTTEPLSYAFCHVDAWAEGDDPHSWVFNNLIPLTEINTTEAEALEAFISECESYGIDMTQHEVEESDEFFQLNQKEDSMPVFYAYLV